MLEAPWRIELFGALMARQDDPRGRRVVTRFRSHRTGVLFALLALHPKRAHGREELIELLWPDYDLDAGRTSLRTALSSLRRQFEPPGTPAGSVLIADRTHVRLNPDAITTDVAEFEAALRDAERSADDGHGVAFLARAVALRQGPLLPGCYEAWILAERDRLDDVYRIALEALTTALERQGKAAHALDYAHQMVSADPLREEAHLTLMRLYATLGRPADALRHYREMEQTLARELGSAPSPAARAFASRLSGAPPGAEMPAFVPSPVTRAPAPSAPPEPPSPAPMPEVRLPLTLTRFFGREKEGALLHELLGPGTTRLVTLTGLGGSGKTRLAIEAARSLAGQFGESVWFVPLADIADARWIGGAVADALGREHSHRAEPLEQVIETLSPLPRSLLILDNFEQVAEEGVSVVLTLLRRVGTLSCLVTSRRQLGIEGERLLPVPPLPVPEPGENDAKDDPEDLLSFASVQLFADRAQAAQPDFQVTRGNAAAVAALCARLEGVPLAIELAAARARVLTPAQMLERLAQRFELLASRRTDKEPRHRSLWAVIDWSYHLLTPEQQRLFGRLSVFRGGWTADAAESVCDDCRALEYLSQLRVHSLVAAGETDSEMRFRLLEAVREFAWEQISEEERRDVRRRHLAFFGALAADAEPNLKGPEQASWLRRLDADHDNLRAALTWCGEANDAAGELRLAGALWRFWAMRGHVSGGRQHLAAAIAHAVALGIPDGRAAVLRGAGNLAYLQGDLATAAALHEEHLALCHESDDAIGVATALSDLGNVACAAGDYGRARSLFEESLAFDRARGDIPGVASSLLNLGNVAYFQGDLSAARTLHEEALMLERELGDRQNVANSLLTLGTIADEQADYEAAAACLAESLSLLRELGDRNGIAAALENLATLAMAMGETERALRLFEESLALGRETGIAPRIAGPLSGLGHLARNRGDVAGACALWRESIEILRRIGDRRGMAHLLEGFASIEPMRPGHKSRETTGAHARAAQLLAAADALREAAAAPRSANEQARYDDDLARVRTALGEPSFTEAWAAGRAMPLDDAVAAALEQCPGG